MLAPAGIHDEGARRGSELLLKLPETVRLSVFADVMLKDASITDVSAAYAESDGQRDDLVRALRRLKFVGGDLAKSMRVPEKKAAEKQEKIPQSLDDLAFGPNTPFEDLWSTIDRVAQRNMDVMQELAKLYTHKKVRLKAMLSQLSKLPNGALMSAQVISTHEEGMRKILETLLQAQLKTDVLKAAPERMEHTVNHSFGEAIGGLSGDDRDALTGAAKSLSSALLKFAGKDSE